MSHSLFVAGNESDTTERTHHMAKISKLISSITGNKAPAARKSRAKKTDAQKAAILASIDQVEEHNATSASVVDHHTQTGSWVKPDVAEQIVLDAALEALDIDVIEPYAAPSSVSDQASDAPTPIFDCGDFANNLSDDELDAIAELTADESGSYVSFDGNMDAQSIMRQSFEPEAEASDEPQASNDVVEDEAPKTLSEILVSFSDEAVAEMVVEIAGELDDRAAFELRKNPDNGNIQGTLKKVRAQMVTKRAAKLLLSISVTPFFINRELHNGSAYNVYALGKVGDLIKGATDGVVANAINIACMKSLFAFRAAGATFTMECAKGAASKQYALTGVEASIRKHLISHTVSSSTAPTQASSTMQALETLGVVTRQGGGKNPSYTLTDAPITKKLEAMLLAA